MSSDFLNPPRRLPHLCEHARRVSRLLQKLGRNQLGGRCNTWHCDHFSWNDANICQNRGRENANNPLSNCVSVIVLLLEIIAK